MEQLIRHLPEIVVDKTNPFLHCKLGRESIAPILTDVVSTYGQTGIVIALDGAWGSGKTTFVRMWTQYLKNNGFAALYFNAWECDFVDDPLVALLGELKELHADDSNYKKVASVGVKVLAAGAWEAGKSLLKKFTGLDSEKIIDKTSDVLEGEFTKALDQYAESKATLLEFKKALQEFIASNVSNIEHPVVFIVDELDRCCPTFAVKTLERIKHLFDIPNLVFVIATNKEQLQYAIQGYYGSPNLDGNAYLRRFIDLEYSLPKPETEAFCQYLFDQYGFSDFFDSPERKKYGFESESTQLLNLMAKTIGKSSLSLRSVDKIINHCRLALKGFANNQYVHPDLFVTLCYMRLVYPEVYSKIRNNQLTIQELLDVLESQVFKEILTSQEAKYHTTSKRQIAYTIGKMLSSYNINKNGIKKFDDFKPQKNDEGKDVFPVKVNTLDNEMIQDALTFYSKRFHELAPIEHLIKRIDITQSIQH